MPDGRLNSRVADLEKTVARIERKINHLESKTNTPREKHETGEGPQETPNQESTTAPRQSAPVLQVKSTPINSQRPQKPWYRAIEGWKVRLELVAIPFAIGYAAVTYFQWRDLKYNFINEQRSWINPILYWSVADRNNGVDPNIPVPEEMFSGDVIVRLVNEGKSPIFWAKTETRVEVLDHQVSTTFDLTPIHNSTDTGLIFPGGHIDTDNDRWDETGKIFNPTDTETQLLRKGTDYVVIFGYAQYGDQFGIHWTRFCGWWYYRDVPPVPIQPMYNADMCVKFNATGEGSPIILKTTED